MSTPAEWTRAYARQADADFRAWELYEEHPQAIAAECHKLLFLQMACEKLCKAHLIQHASSPSDLQASHAFIAKNLHLIIREEATFRWMSGSKIVEISGQVKRQAHEIELLNPAVTRDKKRPDNCEYPWEDHGGNLHSPLDWTFHPLRFCTAPGGRTFLKLLRGAIDRSLA